MSRLALAVLLASLAACGKPKPAGAPTADELGTEAATFPHVLVPVSTSTIAGFEDAAARLGDPRAVSAADFTQTYELENVTIAGRAAQVMVGYANPWLAPADALHQPMNIPQFLRACESRGRDAVLVAPKGQIYIPRAQLQEVRAKVITLGVADADLPIGFIRGNLR